MKVGMYYSNSDIRVEEIPTPEIGTKEVLVKVIASGICGSDIMEWYRIKTAPRVLGHEITGEIVSVGSEVKKYKKGDRVFVSHHVPCNTCRYCLTGHHTACNTLRSTNFDPGGFSQYIRIPEINVDRGVFILPDEVSYTDGSLIEPLGCVVRGQKTVNIGVGDSVLVLGSGLSGLIHIQLAKALGASKVFATDIHNYRLEAAKRFGANEVINAKKDIPTIIKKVNNNRLVNHVIICTGAVTAVNQAISSIDRSGTILFFAPTEPNIKIPVDLNYVWKNDITFKTTYGASPEDIILAIDLLANNKVDLSQLITHKLPMSDIALGFRLASEGAECLKVVIEPNK